MTTDKNKQGISLEADAGFELNIRPSNIKVQAGKVEALFRPQDGSLKVIKFEGSKSKPDASLKAGPAGVTLDSKEKLGATFLITCFYSLYPILFVLARRKDYSPVKIVAIALLCIAAPVIGSALLNCVFSRELRL